LFASRAVFCFRKISLPASPIDLNSQHNREIAKRVVLFTAFLDILGFGIIIPQLGIYAAQFGARPEVVGLLAASYSVMQFLFAPIWGRLSDRIGRRPVLVWSIFGTAIGYVIFAFANAMPWLFASRILDGITGANISTAQAYLSDVTDPKDRAKTYGIFGAIFGIGFAIGPLIGALLAHLPGVWGGNLGIGLFTATLSFINWALALKFLPETLTAEVRAANTARHANQKSSDGKLQLLNIAGFKRAFAVPGLGRVLTIGFISILAFATMQGTFTLFIIKRYIRPETQTYIRKNPDLAVAQAQRHLMVGQSSHLVTSEDGAPQPTGDLDQPFAASMGGDFKPQNIGQPPEGLSWRRVEKLLVQPRAAQAVGWIFAVIGVIVIIVQGTMISKLQKRFGQLPMIIGGTLMLTAGLALVPLPPTFLWQFPVAALIAIGNSISAPILTALVSILAPEAERGEVIGVFQSTQSLGRMFGPVLGGYLFDHVSSGAPYFTGAAIMFVAFLMACGLGKACGHYIAEKTAEGSPASA
jgi:MFS family permease